MMITAIQPEPVANVVQELVDVWSSARAGAGTDLEAMHVRQQLALRISRDEGLDQLRLIVEVAAARGTWVLDRPGNVIDVGGVAPVAALPAARGIGGPERHDANRIAPVVDLAAWRLRRRT